MEVRKLKLIWQQVNDSTNHLYQPWSFFTVEQPRKTVPNHVNSSMSTNELHHIFVPTSMPMMGNMSSAASSISMMHTEQPVLMHPPPLTKPSVYQPPLDTTAHVFVPPPMPYATHEHPAKMQPSNLETFVQPMTGILSCMKSRVFDVSYFQSRNISMSTVVSPNSNPNERS